jgi:hypothetical protein
LEMPRNTFVSSTKPRRANVSTIYRKASGTETGTNLRTPHFWFFRSLKALIMAMKALEWSYIFIQSQARIITAKVETTDVVVISSIMQIIRIENNCPMNASLISEKSATKGISFGSRARAEMSIGLKRLQLNSAKLTIKTAKVKAS